jgi:hypothetical protein
VADWDLDEHELTLLRQAVHAADLCDRLQERVDQEGELPGGRVNPALVELRQQRQQLARLIVALRVPLGDEEQQVAPRQRRGMRGMYGFRVVEGGKQS